MVAPGMLAEPAQDDDGEGLQRGEIAHGRVDHEHGPEQRAGGGGEARAQRERGGVMVLISTPISAAVSRSWKVARMALPSLVRLMRA